MFELERARHAATRRHDLGAFVAAAPGTQGPDVYRPGPRRLVLDHEVWLHRGAGPERAVVPAPELPPRASRLDVSGVDAPAGDVDQKAVSQVDGAMCLGVHSPGDDHDREHHQQDHGQTATVTSQPVSSSHCVPLMRRCRN